MPKSHPRCTESESTFSQDPRWLVSYYNVRSLSLPHNVQQLNVVGKTPCGLAPAPLSSSAPYLTLLLPLGTANHSEPCKHTVLFPFLTLLHLLSPLLELPGHSSSMKPPLILPEAVIDFSLWNSSVSSISRYVVTAFHWSAFLDYNPVDPFYF